MRLDLPSRADRSGRAASAALPPNDPVQVRPTRRGQEIGADHRPTARLLACDVCGNARTRGERHRLVWESVPANRLVLAELCRNCAMFADVLLDLYGGCGRDSVVLVHEIRASLPTRSVQPRVFGHVARGILYLLIALAAFVLVTMATSGAR
jgi:hypothetical protein